MSTVVRVTTHITIQYYTLQNNNVYNVRLAAWKTWKSQGYWTLVREKSLKMEKDRENYNHHLAAVREKDIK